MKKLIYIIIIFTGFITSSCVSYMFVFYREEPIVTYHKDTLIKINNYFVDTNNILSINFKANLHGKKREKNYYVKIPLNRNYKDTVFYNKVSINNKNEKRFEKYKGYTEINIKRSSIKTNIDTISQTKIDTINKKLTSFNISTNYSISLNSIFNDNKVIFQYLPEDREYFYYINLKQKKKWDKRYLLPLTVCLDIVTLPVQVIFIFPEWIKGMKENKKLREKESSKK